MLNDLTTGVKSGIGIVILIAAASFGYFAYDRFVDGIKQPLQQRIDDLTKSYAEYRKATEEASNIAAKLAIETDKLYREREREIIDEAKRMDLAYKADLDRLRASGANSDQRLRAAEAKLGRALSQLASNARGSSGSNPGSSQVSDAGGAGTAAASSPVLVHDDVARRIRESFDRHFGPIARAGDEVLLRQYAICYRVIEKGSEVIRRTDEDVH